MTVWCKCGHEEEEHSYLVDSETRRVMDTYCHGGMKTDKDDDVMIMIMNCPCKVFVELKSGKEQLEID